MPKAICRCGQPLSIPDDGSNRVVCPNCGAKVRLKRAVPAGGAGEGDGYIRFNCACGRRLKVTVERADGSTATCPDCGGTVRIPSAGAMPTTRARSDGQTDEFTPEQIETLRQWTEGWTARRGELDPAEEKTPVRLDPVPRPAVRPNQAVEAGFRVCPKCKKPIHLGADTCRACGTLVPGR